MVWSTISVLDWYSSQFSSVRETSQVDEVSTFDAVSSRSLIGIQYHVTWMTGHVRLVFSPRSFAMKLHRARIENRRTRAVGSSGLHFFIESRGLLCLIPFQLFVRVDSTARMNGASCELRRANCILWTAWLRFHRVDCVAWFLTSFLVRWLEFFLGIPTSAGVKLVRVFLVRCSFCGSFGLEERGPSHPFSSPSSLTLCTLSVSEFGRNTFDICYWPRTG